MCIIAIKNKGVSMPDETTIETMFKNNSDGAGFMYAADGKVYIEKGFMNLKDFKKALNKLSHKYDLTDIPVVMHFRIATSGGIDKGTCHPFPITSKRKILRRCQLVTDLAIAHNGVIKISAPDNMSDTMQYVSQKLSLYKRIQPDFYMHKHFLKRIENEIKSKMVFLNGNGEIVTVGEFVSENDGMVYSNTSYKRYTYTFLDDDFYAYSSYFTDEAMLCPIDGYVIRDGKLIDCADDLYMIDKHGNVYLYDFDFDFAYQTDGQAFTYSGTPYYYDQNSAMYCCIGG